MSRPCEHLRPDIHSTNSLPTQHSTRTSACTSTSTGTASCLPCAITRPCPCTQGVILQCGGHCRRVTLFCLGSIRQAVQAAMTRSTQLLMALPWHDCALSW